MALTIFSVGGRPRNDCRVARYRLDEAIRVTTEITSHTLCSAVFVSGLDVDQVYAETVTAAKLLAVDDVLIDSMRGRSSTWTRVRVNLRHVPEALRPPQETPDPDDDPTREWRKWREGS